MYWLVGEQRCKVLGTAIWYLGCSQENLDGIFQGYIYIYMCVCVCVCAARVGVSLSLSLSLSLFFCIIFGRLCAWISIYEITSRFICKCVPRVKIERDLILILVIVTEITIGHSRSSVGEVCWYFIFHHPRLTKRKLQGWQFTCRVLGKWLFMTSTSIISCLFDSVIL